MGDIFLCIFVTLAPFGLGVLLTLALIPKQPRLVVLNDPDGNVLDTLPWKDYVQASVKALADEIAGEPEWQLQTWPHACAAAFIRRLRMDVEHWRDQSNRLAYIASEAQREADVRREDAELVRGALARLSNAHENLLNKKQLADRELLAALDGEPEFAIFGDVSDRAARALRRKRKELDNALDHARALQRHCKSVEDLLGSKVPPIGGTFRNPIHDPRGTIVGHAITRLVPVRR